MNARELLRAAHRARERAYAPYSLFSVGAALECEDGTVVLGCNVENASFGATLCAERNAIATAIAAGKRSFVRIAIVGGKSDGMPLHACAPCGICRQTMSEFCGLDFEILTEENGEAVSQTLGELLPSAFSAELGRGER